MKTTLESIPTSASKSWTRLYAPCRKPSYLHCSGIIVANMYYIISSRFILLVALAWIGGNHAFQQQIPSPQTRHHRHHISHVQKKSQKASITSSSLQMGLLDQFSKAFLKDREGDFIKLEDSEETSSGLGPAILLYNVPAGIVDDELEDMLEDGAPQASKKGVALQRIPDMNDPLLDLTLEDALQKVVSKDPKEKDEEMSSSSTTTSMIAPVSRGNPVLIFSGFANAEMMASYNIIAEEIFRENGGQAACAKAVPNALPKPLRQVVEEISGDHQSALEMDDTAEE